MTIYQIKTRVLTLSVARFSGNSSLINKRIELVARKAHSRLEINLINYRSFLARINFWENYKHNLQGKK